MSWSFPGEEGKGCDCRVGSVFWSPQEKVSHTCDLPPSLAMVAPEWRWKPNILISFKCVCSVLWALISFGIWVCSEAMAQMNHTYSSMCSGGIFFPSWGLVSPISPLSSLLSFSFHGQRYVPSSQLGLYEALSLSSCSCFPDPGAPKPVQSSRSVTLGDPGQQGRLKIVAKSGQFPFGEMLPH